MENCWISGKNYVLDTSAILALRLDEEGADTVAELLRRAAAGEINIYVSFMSYMEAYHRIWVVRGEEAANLTYWELKTLPIEMVGLTERLLLLAGELGAKYKLSAADAWIIATAVACEAVLVHKDPQFERVKEVVSLLTL